MNTNSFPSISTTAADLPSKRTKFITNLKSTSNLPSVYELQSKQRPKYELRSNSVTSERKPPVPRYSL